MNLTNYVHELQQQLEVAADAGGEEARALAERLIAPLAAATRLILLEALLSESPMSNHPLSTETGIKKLAPGDR